MGKFEIALAADFSIIIPLLLLIVRRQKETPLYYKFIVSFVLLLFIRNTITFTLGELHIYNMYIYNWCNLFSSVIIALLYYNLFDNSYFKWVVIIGMLISVVAAFLDYDSLFNPMTTNFNRFSYNISGCFIIIATLIYFYQLLQSLQVTNLTTFSPFWFSSGALIYYSGTVFSYLYVNYTFNNPDLAIVRSYWMIDALLFIIFCIFLSLTVWYMASAKASK
jgi:hypothetical protein